MSVFYDFIISDLSGNPIHFKDFKGKKVLIVNTASECGFTPQYQQLEELHEMFQKELVVLGIPCNDFGGQEPGSAEEINAFCARNYGVSFTMTQKMNIKGKEMHKLYQWLTEATENGVGDFEVEWNFHKFKIDESGNLVGDLPSAVSPLDEQTINWVKH